MRVLLLASVLVFSSAFAKAAPPVLGADCGAGASIVGSKDAGKVTIGVDPDQNTCTLTGFNWPKVPSCSATLEGPVTAQPYGTISTTNRLTLVYPPFAYDDMRPGNVISYLCVGQ